MFNLIISLILITFSSFVFSQEQIEDKPSIYVFGVSAKISNGFKFISIGKNTITACTSWEMTGSVSPMSEFTPELVFSDPNDFSGYDISDLEQTRLVSIEMTRKCPHPTNNSLALVETRYDDSSEKRTLVARSSAWVNETTEDMQSREYTEWSPISDTVCLSQEFEQTRSYDGVDTRTNYWDLEGEVFASNVQKRLVTRFEKQTVQGTKMCTVEKECAYQVSDRSKITTFSYFYRPVYSGSDPEPICEMLLSQLKWDGFSIYNRVISDQSKCTGVTGVTGNINSTNLTDGAIFVNKDEILYDGFKYTRSDDTGSQVCREPI